jgi:hypothetical protein
VRQRYGRRQGKMPCLHAPKSVWRHPVREFRFMAKAQCLPFVLTAESMRAPLSLLLSAYLLSCLYGACRVMIALGTECSILPVAFNQPAWTMVLTLLRALRLSMYSQRRPASRRRPVHATHSDAVAVSLPRTSSSTIVPVAIVLSAWPLSRSCWSVVNHDNRHAHCWDRKCPKGCQTEGPCDIVPGRRSAKRCCWWRTAS